MNALMQNYGGNANALGVRPVVSLESDVKVSQLKVISGSRGEDWGSGGGLS